MVHTILVVIAVVSASLVAVDSTNATGIYLCTGYAACNSSGHSDAGYSGANGASYWGMYPRHNCTNYAAYRLLKKGIDASYLRGQGNAYQWGSVARSHGIAVDGTPRVGDIAWWDSNSRGSGPTGHVAYVEQVGAGFVVTSEDNFGGDFHWVKLTPGGYYPTGFIHFGGTASPAPSSNSGPLMGHWNRWNNGDHSAITGAAPAGATFEGTFGDLLSVQIAGTTPLYSCNVGSDEFTSPASNCEGQRINGLLGYIYSSPRRES